MNAEPFTDEEIVPMPGETVLRRYIRVMNNFHLHFPAGNDPHNYEDQPTFFEGFNRFMAKEAGWDSTYRELGGNPLFLSDRKLNQTPRLFYEEIDLTVEELGLGMASVSQAVNLMLSQRHHGIEAGRVADIAWAALYPIYVALRKKGYSKEDLRG